MIDFEEFVGFVNAAHGDQKYDTHAYSYHLQQVLDKVKLHSFDPIVWAAAYGHDLFEDTKVTKENFPFDSEIAYLIDLLTDRPGKNRRDRHLNTYWRIRSDPRAVLIKMCDRFCNHEQSIDSKLAPMYAREYFEFKFALYEPNQFDDLWEELDEQYEKLKRLNQSS